MYIYKANKYYTTMNFETFLILGTDEKIIEIAHKLFLNIIENSFDDSKKSFEKFDDYIKENNLIYLDDVRDPLEIGTIDNELEVVIDSDGKAYVYHKVNDYESRF